MNYDNVDKKNLRNIGIAYILKKNNFSKDRKTITYYEIIDCCCGFLYEYSNSGLVFTFLSKDPGLQLHINYNPNRQFLASNFKTFYEFCRQNNYVLDIPLFISEYKKHIG